MRRRGFNRVWILAIALLIALGAMGVTYAAWTDDIYIDGSISTTSIDDGLTCGTCSPASGDSYITCAAVANDPLKLTITVKNAQFDAENPKDYYCEFELSNEVDSWPVEVTSMSLINPFSAAGVVAEISSGTGDLQVGDVINPGASATGKVHIYLTDNTVMGQNLSFTLTVTVE
jgi:hypothetical protein